MRLILDSPAPGVWNMAVDELLLESAAARGEATLRIYEWSEATLSLGYFQNHQQREHHARLAPLSWLRRPSGGGAIVHDREITYSLVVSTNHEQGRDGPALYQTVHHSIVSLLAKQGILAQVLDAGEKRPASQEPFLCFQRRSVGDVVQGAHKIGGSAQRKRHGVVLQHGSFLLAASSAVPELRGIEDLTGRALDRSLFSESFPRELARRWNEPIRLEPLSSQEQERAREIQRQVFDDPAWNRRR